MPRQASRSGFAWLELLLLLAVLVLLVQVFPGLLAALDVTDWSRSTWWNVNLGLVLILLTVRFGHVIAAALVDGAAWLIRRLRPQAPGTQRPRRRKREDVRWLLQREEVRRLAAKRRMIVRGSLCIAIAALSGALMWRTLFDDPDSSAFQPLFTNHPGIDNERGALVGGSFQVRADENVEVTHLGLYDHLDDGMDLSHQVGLFELPSGDVQDAKLLADVTIPFGKRSLLLDGYRWEPLPAPLELRAGSSYALVAQISPDSRDFWPDCFLESGQPARPEWNPFFVDLSALSTEPLIGTGDEGWPAVPSKRAISALPSPGAFFGAVNLARIEPDIKNSGGKSEAADE